MTTSTTQPTPTTSPTVITYCGAQVAAPGADMDAYKIGREGDRPLKFRGWLLGEGKGGSGGSGSAHDWNRRICIQIFVTTGGRLVTSVERTSCWQGERDTCYCAAHATPADALDWLRADAGGELGRASLEAWEAACAAWEPLAAEDAEVVE